MGAMFGKTPKAPAPPKPIRMPQQEDPEMLAAAQRTRQAMLERKGRLSTILTDQTQATTGSSGVKLGA